jgi:hypothetical protein
MIRAPSRLVHLEPEAELIPKRPLGFMPFRYKHDFWNQKIIIEVWRGTSYARISGSTRGSTEIIDCAIQSWKHFGKRN